MPKLHLVGITPDHRGLVLSEHARAKRGDMVLEIDDRLLEAIDKAHRLRTRDEGHHLESAALPTKRELVNGDGAAPRLSPREIQQRLRAGESVTALARSSGTEEAWIRRFAAPVLAEQAKVLERARTVTFNKRGVGPSGAALAPAVAANVIDRGVPLTLPDLEAGWRAYQHPEGGWHVTFTFQLRGRRQTAEWEIDLASGELTARNKLASELAWREPGRKLPQPKPTKPPAAKPAKAPAAKPGKAPAAKPAPAGEASPAAATADEPEGAETAPVLPLHDEPTSLPSGPGGPVRKAPASARKAPARKAPSSKAPAGTPAPTAKRAAAAMTETPVQSVVPVVSPGTDPETGPARPAGSMPPTDLDVVDVTGEFPVRDDDSGDVGGSELVIVIPPSADDDVLLVDEPKGPEPAPLGAPPAPPGGPPAP
jgi:hypothetical protein